MAERVASIGVNLVWDAYGNYIVQHMLKLDFPAAQSSQPGINITPWPPPRHTQPAPPVGVFPQLRSPGGELRGALDRRFKQQLISKLKGSMLKLATHKVRTPAAAPEFLLCFRSDPK